LDPQVLVAQMQIHEQLVVTLVQQVGVQQVLVQLVQEQQLVVAPLELVERLLAQKKLMAQKNYLQPENLAYLF
jgi:hypothetical protein